MYSVALPWYRYTMSIIQLPSSDNNNAIALARLVTQRYILYRLLIYIYIYITSKLSLCYEHLDDFNAAYTYMKQGLDNSSETAPATAEDYLLFLRFSFTQDEIEQKIGKSYDINYQYAVFS